MMTDGDGQITLKLPTGAQLTLPVAELMRQTGMTREELMRA